MKKILLLCALFVLCGNVFFQTDALVEPIHSRRMQLEKELYEKALSLEKDTNQYYSELLSEQERVLAGIIQQRSWISKLNFKQNNIIYELQSAKNEIVPRTWVVIIILMLLVGLASAFPKLRVIFLVLGVLICVGFVFFEFKRQSKLSDQKRVELRITSIFGKRYRENLRILGQQEKSLKLKLSAFTDSLHTVVEGEAEKICQREIFVRDSLITAEKLALEKYIKDNNFSKKLRIIACSWEKKPDIPERGSIKGKLTSSGNLSVGGAMGFVSGGGSAESYGTLSGEYTGRIYGEEYQYFHFILSDNSYHVIDVTRDKKWRMAKNGLIVKYEKIYSNYDLFTTKLSPLYNESY